MELRELLTAIEAVKEEENNIQTQWDLKLQELRAFQQHVIKRAENLSNNLFPKEVRDIMYKISEGKKFIPFNIENQKLLIDPCLDFFVNNDSIRAQFKDINVDIPDWWAKPGYREDHISWFNNELRKINEIYELIENHIEEIYAQLANKINKYLEEQINENTILLNKVNIPTSRQKSKKIIINIEFVEGDE